MLKNKSIGTKITLFLSVVIIIAFSLMSYISYLQSASGLESSINNDMQAQAINNAHIVAEKLDGYKKVCQEVALGSTIKSMDWSTQLPNLLSIKKSIDFYDMSIIKPDGSFTSTTGTKTNSSTADFFKKAMNGIQNVSDPKVSKVDGKMIIIIATPIKDDNGKIIGVLGATLDGQFLSEQCKSISIGKAGYGFIINSAGTVIGHKDGKLVATQDNVMKNIKKDSSLIGLVNVVKKMTSGAKGIDTYSYNNSEKYLAYTPIPGTTWSLGVTAAKNDVLSSVNAMKNQTIIMSVIFIAIIIFICLLSIRFLITKPLKKTADMIQELSKGHLKERLEVKSGDEVGRMSKAMNTLADVLQFNILGSLKQIAAGDMNVKIESKDEKDEIAPVVMDTAATVKSIVNETSGIIEAVNDGILDERCNDAKYNGEWKTLAQKINSLCDSVSAPIEEVRSVIGKISVCDFSVKMEGQYKGIFKTLTDDTNKACDILVGLENVITKISNGDTSLLEYYKKIGKLSENDSMIPAIISMMSNIENLIKEVEHLSVEAVNGNIINARGDANKFEGGYKKIVDGFNNTLEAVSEPLSEVITVLGNLAVNDFTLKSEGNYQGDFYKLAKSVNDVQSGLVTLQHIAVRISNGDISLLEAMKKNGKLSNNDELMPAFIGMTQNIKFLIDETTYIANSAAQGKLDVRGDVTKFNGGYANIINAINSFMDAVEKPTNKITDLMNLISQAKFGETIDGEFSGQFEILVNAVNKTSTALKEVIQNVSDTITRMADGDFSIERIKAYQGDMSSISDALNTILDSFNELFGTVGETAAQVSAGSAQVSQGSQQLSQGATEQASSVEQLSASITEVASQTKQNAVNASKANNLVGDVKSNAANGSSQMNEMLKSMDEISESSQNISKIIKVIDDIAFQTNILALNAAVEAARAGQAGKGFAVVADEVRNLAAKSATAAKDTTLLIESTVGKVESGTEIANITAKAFEGIVSGVDKVVELVSEITSASNEQATGISQINQGLEQVSKVIQTNSATAEESAAASEELSSQAAMLNEQISKFTLRG